jgi:hypothetical protein
MLLYFCETLKEALLVVGGVDAQIFSIFTFFTHRDCELSRKETKIDVWKGSGGYRGV